ncbi:hypothetical protein ENBRE01_1530 [Enteropsectra breve]|nr:hypothetical protein ENBRE01_1530 [Enteropsectra breve]
MLLKALGEDLIYYGIALAIVVLVGCIVWLVIKSLYSSISTYLRDAASFIFSNKEIKAWLIANEFPEGSKTHALKALLKIVDEGIEYKNLPKSEQNSIRNFDYFLRSITYNTEEKAPVSIKFMQILQHLENDNSGRPDSPFNGLFVKYNRSLTCPSTKRTVKDADNYVFLYTKLSPSDLDAKGTFDFEIKPIYEDAPCTQCNSTYHNETMALDFVSANKYFIWRIEAVKEFKNTPIQFRERYHLKNEVGEILQPNEYEVLSVLYIKDSSIMGATMHYVENKGQPLVFNDFQKDGAYYAMMKERSN